MGRLIRGGAGWSLVAVVTVQKVSYGVFAGMDVVPMVAG